MSPKGAIATALIAIALTAGTAILVSEGGEAVEEKATAPSEEVRQLADPRSGCPFERRPLLFLHTHPQPLSSRLSSFGCGYLEQDRVRIERFAHDGPHGSFRLEYVKSRGDVPNRFIVHLVAGPEP